MVHLFCIFPILIHEKSLNNFHNFHDLLVGNSYRFLLIWLFIYCLKIRRWVELLEDAIHNLFICRDTCCLETFVFIKHLIQCVCCECAPMFINSSMSKILFFLIFGSRGSYIRIIKPCMAKTSSYCSSCNKFPRLGHKAYIMLNAV